MKKSYHSMVVPTVAAITALRNCALCSRSESPLDVAILAMGPVLPKPTCSDDRSLTHQHPPIRAIRQGTLALRQWVGLNGCKGGIVLKSRSDGSWRKNKLH